MPARVLLAFGIASLTSIACAPVGSHRYFFKLSALATTLAGPRNPTKPQVEQAMQGHVIGSTQVIGTYERAKK